MAEDNNTLNDGKVHGISNSGTDNTIKSTQSAGDNSAASAANVPSASGSPVLSSTPTMNNSSVSPVPGGAPGQAKPGQEKPGQEKPGDTKQGINKQGLLGLGLIVLVVIAVSLFSIAYTDVTENKSEDAGSQKHGLHHKNHKGSASVLVPSRHPMICPDVEVIAVPGTWESTANDDPFNPTFNPRSLMLRITKPLNKRYAFTRVETYTVPYVAQLRNPGRRYDVPYDQSRLQGLNAAESRVADVSSQCPLTKFILVGFSQGARIAGDLANEIGVQHRPVSPDRVAFVGLISDPRRVHGKSFDAQPSPEGDGIEVSLQGFGALSHSRDMPLPLDSVLGIDGLTMSGPRPNDFGQLDGKTIEICAQNDFFCDSPKLEIGGPGSTLVKLLSLLQPTHGNYAYPTYWNNNGKSAVEWVLDKIIDTVEHIPASR